MLKKFSISLGAFAIIVCLIALASGLLVGCNSNLGSDYQKIVYIEGGNYYYFTSTDKIDLQRTNLDASFINDSVRMQILSIKKFPCEVLLSRNLSNNYTVLTFVTPQQAEGEVK